MRENYVGEQCQRAVSENPVKEQCQRAVLENGVGEPPTPRNSGLVFRSFHNRLPTYLGPGEHGLPALHRIAVTRSCVRDIVDGSECVNWWNVAGGDVCSTTRWSATRGRPSCRPRRRPSFPRDRVHIHDNKSSDQCVLPKPTWHSPEAFFAMTEFEITKSAMRARRRERKVSIFSVVLRGVNMYEIARKRPFWWRMEDCRIGG